MQGLLLPQQISFPQKYIFPDVAGIARIDPQSVVRLLPEQALIDAAIT